MLYIGLNQIVGAEFQGNDSVDVELGIFRLLGPFLFRENVCARPEDPNVRYR